MFRGSCGRNYLPQQLPAAQFFEPVIHVAKRAQQVQPRLG
jgi:hypothetical protein